MTNVRFSTREEWLTWATQSLNEKIFIPRNMKCLAAEDLKLSCGFPLGSRGSKDKLGQCLSPDVSASDKTEIYISPTVSDPIEVLGVLHHECIHAYIGVDQGHGKTFVFWAKKTGLEGPAKSTRPSDFSKKLYAQIVEEIGDYPHSAVNIPERGSKGSPLKKFSCPQDGYTVRITEKWVSKGAPYCGICTAQLVRKD